MNKKYFKDIVNGQFGRKIAYTDVDSITIDNVVDVVNSAMSTFFFNRKAILYLWNYYKGDQPINYRKKEKAARDDIINKVCVNHAYEIVQFKTGQTYGEPIQYVSRKDDESINTSVDELNDYMVDVNKQSVDIRSGEWQSATGTSFKAVQKSNDKEIPFRIVSPCPLDTFIVYSRSNDEPMLSVQLLKDKKGNKYKLCFSDNMQFTVYGDRVTDARLHSYGSIPIEEYPNNWERISDIELVIDILDGINTIQSNRQDGIEQFVSSWVKFVNCDVDYEKFQQMKMAGALVVTSGNGQDKNADVDLITQELDQTQTQVAKEDLWDSALSVLAIPNKEKQNSGGDSQGAVELRAGWDFSKTRAKLKDALVKSSEKRLVKVILNVLRINGMSLNLSTRDFDVQINHSPTDNMIVKCQSLQYLLTCGIHPLIAINTVGLWGDAEKVFIQSQPYLDNLWKTLDMAKTEGQEEKAQELLEYFNRKAAESEG